MAGEGKDEPGRSVGCTGGGRGRNVDFRRRPLQRHTEQVSDVPCGGDGQPKFETDVGRNTRNTAPIPMPMRTLGVFQWETSKDSSRFFSSRYCSSTPVLRLLYISSYEPGEGPGFNRFETL